MVRGRRKEGTIQSCNSKARWPRKGPPNPGHTTISGERKAWKKQIPEKSRGKSPAKILNKGRGMKRKTE